MLGCSHHQQDMETPTKLGTKVIIYDDVCPLCKAYTSGFVRAGWLRPENRVGFAEAPSDLIEGIDIERARHEIPLYDRATGETIYGKEALFFILGEAIPAFRPLFRMPLFRVLIFCLYQIITYNRRIIANSQAPTHGFDCAPDFNGFYRWMYIGLMGMFSGLLLFQANLNFDGWMSILTLLVGLAVLRGCLMGNFKAQTTYFGHLATVLFIFSFLIFSLQSLPYVAPVVSTLSVWLFYRRMRRLSN